MAQSIPSALAARAYAAEIAPVGANAKNRQASSSRPAAGGRAIDQMSGPAFVVQLSAQARRAVHNHHVAENSAGQAHGSKSVRMHRAGASSAPAEISDITDFNVEIGADGTGRREAPLAGGAVRAVHQPAGSIIDITV